MPFFPWHGCVRIANSMGMQSNKQIDPEMKLIINPILVFPNVSPTMPLSLSGASEQPTKAIQPKK